MRRSPTNASDVEKALDTALRTTPPAAEDAWEEVEERAFELATQRRPLPRAKAREAGLRVEAARLAQRQCLAPRRAQADARDHAKGPRRAPL